MNGDRSEQALARIEAALARMEAGLARHGAGAPHGRGADDGAEVVQLRQKHEQLRTAVTQSLHQLDALIGGEQP